MFILNKGTHNPLKYKILNQNRTTIFKGSEIQSGIAKLIWLSGEIYLAL
jgi:hypothetical protein